MFKTAEELKDFILWAKKHKLKSLKVGDIAIELSEIAYALEEPETEPLKREELSTTRTWVDDEPATPNLEDEDLYLSSGN